MSKTTIRVVARVVALPDKVEQVKSVLMGLLEPTHQEEGCIVYQNITGLKPRPLGRTNVKLKCGQGVVHWAR